MTIKLINKFNVTRGRVNLEFNGPGSPLPNRSNVSQDPPFKDNISIGAGGSLTIKVMPSQNQYCARFWFSSYENLEISNKGNEWTIKNTANGITKMASGSGNVTIGDDNQHPIIGEKSKEGKKDDASK